MVETFQNATVLTYQAPGLAQLQHVALAAPHHDEARVHMIFSGISRGTERLVFNGQVPCEEYEAMRCPFQSGSFAFPVAYGYCAVGVVEAGPGEWLGRTVFVLHPHQDKFVVPVAALAMLPPDVPPRRATLAANMETALNAVWDSAAGPGDRITIVGAGVIGLLVAYLCARLPGAQVQIADIVPERAEIARAFGAEFVDARDVALVQAQADLVFHTSATPEGLSLALASAGQEANLVEMSWYGTRPIAVPLGGAFHSRRLKIISAQVGQISQARRPRWSHARRMNTALALLADARLDALLTGEVAFAELPGQLAALLAPGAAGLATLVTYPQTV